MKTLNQLLLDFEHKQNFSDDDFYVGKSNFYTFELINKWPKWEKNFLNISGENFSGKSHLVDIFLKKYRGVKFDTNNFNEQCLDEIKLYQNIVLEDLTKNVNQKILFSLYNIVEQDNKYLIMLATAVFDIRRSLPFFV